MAGRGLRVRSAHPPLVAPAFSRPASTAQPSKRQVAKEAEGPVPDETPGRDAANPHSRYPAPGRKWTPEPTTGREQKSAKNRAGLGRERARGPAQEGLTPPLRPRPCAERRSSSSPISKPEIPRAARAEKRTRGALCRPGRGRRNGLRFEVSQTPRLSGKRPLERRGGVAAGEEPGRPAEYQKEFRKISAEFCATAPSFLRADDANGCAEQMARRELRVRFTHPALVAPEIATHLNGAAEQTARRNRIGEAGSGRNARARCCESSFAVPRAGAQEKGATANSSTSENPPPTETQTTGEARRARTTHKGRRTAEDDERRTTTDDDERRATKR